MIFYVVQGDSVKVSITYEDVLPDSVTVTITEQDTGTDVITDQVLTLVNTRVSDGVTYYDFEATVITLEAWELGLYTIYYNGLAGIIPSKDTLCFELVEEICQ